MSHTIETTLLAIVLNEIQLADRWGISRKTLQAQRLRGDGPRFIKIGKAVRYRLSDIIAYEEANTCESTSQVSCSKSSKLEQ